MPPQPAALYFPQPDPSAQKLQAQVESGGDLTSFALDLSESQGDLQLDVFVTFPYRLPHAVSLG